MTVSYKKLWKLLIDKNLKKKDLIRMSGISNYTLNKLNAGKSVTTDTLVKICATLHCGTVKVFMGCLRVRTPLFLCLKYP